MNHKILYVLHYKDLKKRIVFEHTYSSILKSQRIIAINFMLYQIDKNVQKSNF